MFIGHYAVAFAAKKASPRTSLGWLVAAVSFLDLLWPLLLLTGAEQVAARPGGRAFLALEFTAYPWSHSLAFALLWSLLLGGLYGAWKREGRGALVIGLGVLSHWVLDWITHVPDLPVWPYGPVAGLSLWTSTAATLVVEGAMFAVGLALYLRLTRPRNATGRWALAGFVALLLVAYLGSTFGPPPPSMKAVAWTTLLCWLFPFWAAWIDRNRVCES